MEAEPLTLASELGDLDAELLLPTDPAGVLVLAHGAGAGYRHATLVGISEALASRSIATLRFNFPFMQARRHRVDSREVAMSAIVDVVGYALGRLPDLPLFLGGHSFGGRMATHVVAEDLIVPWGLVCLSFPLHPAGRPGIERAAHLVKIDVPMLFLSGTRDALADAALLGDVARGLDDRAQLHWLDDADHGYRVRKRERRDPRPVFDEIADEITAFVAAHPECPQNRPADRLL